MKNKTVLQAGGLILAAALALTACTPQPAATTGEGKGDIQIWYSATQDTEKAWAEEVVKAWNAEHPDEQVKASAVPQSTDSNAAVQAAIVAGNVPCLVYNMDSAGIQQFVATGGVVNLSTTFSDGDSFINERSGEQRATSYKFDGSYYSIPWKSNPDMLIYDKDMFAAAGLDAENPELATYSEVTAAAKQIVDSGAATTGLAVATEGEYFRNWWEWYPLYIAATGGKLNVIDGESQYGTPESIAAGEFFKAQIDQGSAPKQVAPNTSFLDGTTAMIISGAYWVSLLRDKDRNIGVVPVPLPDNSTQKEIWTFADAKEISMFTACESQTTAWEFLKYSLSLDSDMALLDLSWQIPLRTGIADSGAQVLTDQPLTKIFAEQAERSVDLAVTPNGVQVWQNFRDEFVKSVLEGTSSVADAFKAADEANAPLLAN